MRKVGLDGYHRSLLLLIVLSVDQELSSIRIWIIAKNQNKERRMIRVYLPLVSFPLGTLGSSLFLQLWGEREREGEGEGEGLDQTKFVNILLTARKNLPIGVALQCIGVVVVLLVVSFPYRSKTTQQTALVEPMKSSSHPFAGFGIFYSSKIVNCVLICSLSLHDTIMVSPRRFRSSSVSSFIIVCLIRLQPSPFVFENRKRSINNSSILSSFCSLIEICLGIGCALLRRKCALLCPGHPPSVREVRFFHENFQQTILVQRRIRNQVGRMLLLLWTNNHQLRICKSLRCTDHFLRSPLLSLICCIIIIILL